jgi:hypothetical protein
VVVHLIRQLVGLTVALALVLGVTHYVGPQLAARSMTGYVAELHAAESGNLREADSIAAQLQRDWRSLSADVTRLLREVQNSLRRMAPRR